MELLEIMRERHSVRQYQDKKNRGKYSQGTGGVYG